jgi:cytochrome P450 family 135
MRRIALAVILRTVFGLNGGEERDRVARAVLTMMTCATESRSQLIRMAARRDLTAAPASASRLGRLLAEVDAGVLAAIESRRRAEADNDDVLSMLLAARDQDGEPMTNRELRDELLTLLLAGYETTAASLSWLFERLLRHPEAWQRVRAEAQGDEQSYLAAAVRETLRTRPVLWLAGRTLLEPTVIDGWSLPAGSLAYLCSYVLHRREDLYPDALRFSPDRWLGANPSPYTFVPFGGGMRRCIGAAFAELEMRTVLAAVAGACDLVAIDPERDERFRRHGIVVVPDRGAEVLLRGRR